MLLSDIDRLWTATAGLLRQQVSDSTWMSCFDAVTPLQGDDSSGEIMLAVPNPIVRERIEGKWKGLMADAFAEVAGRPVTVTIEVRTDANTNRNVTPAQNAATQGSNQGAMSHTGASNNQSSPPEQTAQPYDPSNSNYNAPRNTSSSMSSQNGGINNARSANAPENNANATATPVNARYTFDAFVIGGSNRFAHAAALSVAENPAKAYNPLFIHGHSGLGKTHLLHAIGNYVREQFPNRKVQYVSTETFVNEFIDAIRNNQTTSFKRRYRDCDVLLIDDIQLLEGKETTQEEFFHTFNSLYGAQKQIVITSDRPPKSIATLEDRLRSRFLSGLITDVQPPELETRQAILRKKAEGERAQVPDEVLEFIATHVKDNIRELEGALIRVAAFASLNRMQITVELAEKVLADILAADQPRQITPTNILEATSKMYGFTIDEICGTSRRRPLVNARQIGMYVFRELTDFSYPAIAREFGGRDHTTVIHAVEKVTGLMKEQRRVYDQVTELIHTIKAGGR